jgi:predicted enzyme related to lactoylglutathione lyase
MIHSNFIWADLSTYNITKSIKFYSTVFNWELSDSEEYAIAKVDNSLQAGIFPMPEYLKKINMPHFWMSYFQVNSTAQAVAQAKALNGIIEVENTKFNNGNIALIRDPQGAGFTVYDGNELYLNKNTKHGSIISTELHVSNIDNVLSFYSQLFNWNLEKINEKTYQVKSYQKHIPIKIIELTNKLKGQYEYWVTTIKVDDLKISTKDIINNGGKLISKEINRNLLFDNSGEAFFYIAED